MNGAMREKSGARAGKMLARKTEAGAVAVIR